MENEEPPPPEKLIHSIALTIPFVVVIGFVATSILSTTIRFAVLIGLGAAWLIAIVDCTAIYKHHRFPPKIARRKGLVAGTVVVMIAAVLVLSIAYVGCRK